MVEGWAKDSQNTNRVHQLYQIQYAGSSTSMLAPVRNSPDDPMSPYFVPLDKRTELEQTRFWMRWKMRKRDTTGAEAEFDA